MTALTGTTGNWGGRPVRNDFRWIRILPLGFVGTAPSTLPKLYDGIRHGDGSQFYFSFGSVMSVPGGCGRCPRPLIPLTGSAVYGPASSDPIASTSIMAPSDARWSTALGGSLRSSPSMVPRLAMPVPLQVYPKGRIPVHHRACYPTSVFFYPADQ